MDICDLKYEGNTPNNKHIILCCSIFRLNNMYRDMNKYYDGLKLLINILKNNNKYFLRIYYDFSVRTDDIFIDIKKKCLGYNNIQLCEYYCDKYLDSDTKLHIGIFGMFVRFLPFFDNKLRNNLRIIIDIDYSLFDIYLYIKNNVDKLLKSNYDCLLISYIGYGYRYGNSFNNDVINDALIAHVYLRNISLDITILKNILDKLINRDKYIYNDIINMINNRELLKDNTITDVIIKNKPIDNLFIYGIDEWFVNKILVSEINNITNKIGIMTFMDRIYVYVKYMFNWDLIQNNKKYGDILLKNINQSKSTDTKQVITNYLLYKNIKSYADAKYFYKKINILYDNSKKLYNIDKNTINDKVWLHNLKLNLKACYRY